MIEEKDWVGLSNFFWMTTLSCFRDCFLFRLWFRFGANLFLFLDVLFNFSDIRHSTCESFSLKSGFESDFLLFISSFRSFLFPFEEFMVESLILCLEWLTHFLLLIILMIERITREWLYDVTHVVVFESGQWLAWFYHDLVTCHTEIFLIMHLILTYSTLEFLGLREPVSVVNFNLFNIDLTYNR